jgi:hypothetical protein
MNRRVYRCVIIAAIEAIAAGDIAEAKTILSGALEDGTITRPYPCPICGLRFCWPGELDHHQRFVHPDTEDAA